MKNTSQMLSFASVFVMVAFLLGTAQTSAEKCQRFLCEYGIKGNSRLYLYRSGEIKAFYPGEMSEIKIGGKTEKTNKPIYFKKNGDRYSQAEIDALKKAYDEREGIVEMADESEVSTPPCYLPSLKWIPDKIYRVKAEDVRALDEDESPY